jgi:hypothetical protein
MGLLPGYHARGHHPGGVIPAAERRPTLVDVEAATMNPALRSVYEAILDVPPRYGGQTTWARHEVGRLVDSVLSDPRYGADPVRVLALALGRDRSGLYVAAAVARRWSRAELRVELEKPTATRKALSFSHFAALAAVDDDARRAQLLDVARAGLSVRDVKRLASRNRRRNDDAARVVRRHLGRVTSLASAALPALAAELATFPEHARLASTARDAFRALRAELDAALAELDAAPDSAEVWSAAG